MVPPARLCVRNRAGAKKRRRIKKKKRVSAFKSVCLGRFHKSVAVIILGVSPSVVFPVHFLTSKTTHPINRCQRSIRRTGINNAYTVNLPVLGAVKTIIVTVIDRGRGVKLIRRCARAPRSICYTTVCRVHWPIADRSTRRPVYTARGRCKYTYTAVAMITVLSGTRPRRVRVVRVKKTSAISALLFLSSLRCYHITDVQISCVENRTNLNDQPADVRRHRLHATIRPYDAHAPPAFVPILMFVVTVSALSDSRRNDVVLF